MTLMKAIEVVHDEKFFQKKWSGKRIVRDAYSAAEDPGIDFSKDPGMTDQSQAAECDVNRILDRYAKTGVFPGADVQGLYGDYSSVPDFHASMDIVLRAQDQFDHLDAKVRKRFNNDPAEFLEFVNDPKNAEEMVNLGLATPRAPDKQDAILEAIKGVSDGLKGGSPEGPGPQDQVAPARARSPRIEKS